MHKTVLLNEAIDNLNIKEDGIYVDCTLGGGGHSELILKRISPNGRLISFDIDDVLVDLIISSEQRPCVFLLAKLLNFQGTSPLL